MKLKEISDNLFCVGFKKRRNMCETFVRFHGHYENPKFQNKIFTKKQFDRWFRNETEEGSDLGIDFYSFGGGFNLPEYVFKPFLEGKFNPLSKYEKNLLKEVSKLERKKFYLIGYDLTEKAVLNHEIAHGLYYLNNDYKFEIDTFLAEINKKDILKMKKIIEAENIYSENKIMDELQAHLVNNYYYFLGRNKADEKGIDEEKIKKYSLKINKLFEKYSKNIKGIQPFEL